ncbi:MAG: SGNH/GDSL hydrolase family protein, partial [Betaproteobacteria bacterium]
MKHWLILATLLTTWLTHAQAGDYSNVYFFGDSLSDSGTYAPLIGNSARFTNNPGTVWTDNLGARYGKPVSTAYAAWQTGGPETAGGFKPLRNGNNFAVGGARVNAVPGLIGSFPGLRPYIPPVSTQISDFLARGPVDTKALYAIMAGSNDIITHVNLVMANASTAEEAHAAVLKAAQDFVAQVERLQSAGVSKLMVIGIPDIGKTPFGSSLPASGSALL